MKNCKNCTHYLESHKQCTSPNHKAVEAARKNSCIDLGYECNDGNLAEYCSEYNQKQYTQHKKQLSLFD